MSQILSFIIFSNHLKMQKNFLFLTHVHRPQLVTQAAACGLLPCRVSVGEQSQVRGPALGCRRVRQTGSGHRSPPRAERMAHGHPAQRKPQAAEESHSWTSRARQDGSSEGHSKSPMQMRERVAEGVTRTRHRGDSGEGGRPQGCLLGCMTGRRIHRHCDFLRWVPAARPSGLQGTLGSARGVTVGRTTGLCHQIAARLPECRCLSVSIVDQCQVQEASSGVPRPRPSPVPFYQGLE